MRLPLRGDGTGSVNNYAKAIATIVESKRENKAVLVHCAGGTQRTGGVIAVYRLIIQGKTPDYALKEMKRYGWRPRNKAVINYVNSNMLEICKLLLEIGTIDRIPASLTKLSL